LKSHLSAYLKIGIMIWDLPFDLAQGGEPVEPFDVWHVSYDISGLSEFGIPISLMIINNKHNF